MTTKKRENLTSPKKKRNVSEPLTAGGEKPTSRTTYETALILLLK